MKDLVIIGAGGFGRQVAWIVERINQATPTWNLVGFVDDNEAVHGIVQNGYRVLGSCEYLRDIQRECWVVCAVGNVNARKKIVERVSEYSNVRFATIIDPSVLYSDTAVFGEGSILVYTSVFTTNVTIGKHVIIDAGTTVGHDAVVGDFVTVYPSTNVSGSVQIGDMCEIGMGTRIVQGKSIVAHTITGAGAVVVKDIAESGTYVGCPVKKIK